MNPFIKIAFLVSFFSVFNAFASAPDVTIDSFKVVKAKLGSVLIEVSGVNKSNNAICIAGIAKSNDGLIHSVTESAFGVDLMSIDKKSGKFASVIVVFSPSRTEPKKTDVLFLKVTVCDSPQAKIITSKQFEWTYHWKPMFTENPFRILREKVISPLLALLF